MKSQEKKSTKNPRWSRDELILALNLYMRHRGTAPKKNDPELLKLSSLLNKMGNLIGIHNENFRNPAGVYMKLMNLRRLDPDYVAQGKYGLKQGGHEEESVWKYYFNNLSELRLVSEAIISNINNYQLNNINEYSEENIFAAEEGNLLSRVHYYRERSRKIVDKKKKATLKAHGKLFCEGCGIDFETIYGDRGSGCIEVHHKKPLSQLSPEEKTYIEDLAVICANCHRIIHSKRPWLTLEELQSLLSHKV